MNKEVYKQVLNQLSEEIHRDNVNAGWWNDPKTGENLKDSLYAVFTKLFLVHSEISEAGEGLRKNLNDDHLPHRKMVEVELADAFIRMLDVCGALGLDVGGALVDKWQYNLERADHKVENRLKKGGKSV